MAEHLQLLENGYTSLQKDEMIDMWPMVSYSTEDDNVNYINGQFLKLWVTVPSAGEYSLFGNRTNGSTFDIEQCVRLKIDNDKTEKSLTHEFTENGTHEIKAYFKYNDLNLYRLKDSAASNVTQSTLIKADVSHINGESVTNLSVSFQNCQNVTCIMGLEDWDTSNLTKISSMFNYCCSVTDLNGVANWNVSKCASLDNVFTACYAITTIDVKNWCTSGCTDMDTVFGGCSSLKSLDISKWDTSNVTNVIRLFTYCDKLQNVGDLSAWDVKKINYLAWMFNRNNSLTHVGDLSSWQPVACVNMEGMFSQCYVLTNIGDLSNWDTTNVTTMHAMFNNCQSITSLGIPPIHASTVTNDMFGGCTKLTDITNSGTISASVAINHSPLTHDSALVLINALDADNVGTLTLSTETKALLSEDDIKIATDKGWTIA